MKRLAMICSATSQLINVATAFDLSRTGPNESVSARMHRQRRKRSEAVIDFAFRVLLGERNHCANAYQDDLRGARELLREAGEI